MNPGVNAEKSTMRWKCRFISQHGQLILLVGNATSKLQDKYYLSLKSDVSLQSETADKILGCCRLSANDCADTRPMKVKNKICDTWGQVGIVTFDFSLNGKPSISFSKHHWRLVLVDMTGTEELCEYARHKSPLQPSKQSLPFTRLHDRC